MLRSMQLVMSSGWRKYMLSWMVLAAALIIKGGYVESCVEEDRLALLEIHSNIKSHVRQPNPYISELDWGEGDCCSWDKVQCNPTTQRVTKLHLVGVAAMQHPWVLNVTVFKPLRELVSLDLAYNSIVGLVEKDGSTRITSLKNLQSLRLDYNTMENAKIFLGNLTSLKELYLSGCYLHRSIFPFEELANLRQLQVLDLSGNDYLAGPIEVLSNLTELQVLNLMLNEFHGPIQGLCKLKNIVELELAGNRFYGALPSCLYNLSSLQVLGLSDNYFEGKLSLSVFGNLSKLRVLYLSRNWLEVHTEDSSWQPSFQLQTLGLQDCELNKPNGVVPKFLLQQHNLSDVNLSGNKLVGSFPRWLLNNNSQLRVFDLSNNSLTGYVKLPRYARESLTTLTMSDNNFQGELPEDIGFILPQLKELNMSGNHFEGSIPTSIGHMKQLEVLDLSRNNLSGELPTQLLNSSKLLRLLQLRDNNLQGEITSEQMYLPSLERLSLSNNNFSGTLKDSVLRSSKLNYLDVSNNMLTGLLPSWIGNFSELDTLSISKNFMHGQIPTEICKLQYLVYLDLSQNNFIGSAPSCSNFSGLSFMLLNQNSFTGSIPNALPRSTSLVILDLRGNQLSGLIPSWINMFLRLQVLLLGKNNLHGQIPHALCQLRDIDILDLSDNHLSGEIPSCFVNMSFGIRSIGRFDNGFFSSENGVTVFTPVTEVELLVKNQLHAYIGDDLRLMSELDLSGNKLNGVIPSELGDLSHLHALNLSFNCLSRSMPISFSSLKQIESLDLSYNNLSGTIPYQLSKLNFLEIFNVSYNNLSGRTPETGQFASFDKSNYLGNPGLCGVAVNKPCDPVPTSVLTPPTHTMKEDGDGGLDMEDFLWSFGMTSFIAFMATIVVLGINAQWREAWFDFVEWHLLWWLL